MAVFSTTTRRDFLAGLGLAACSTVVTPGKAKAKMIEPTTIAEQLMYSTARVVGFDENGNASKTGSSFSTDIRLMVGASFPV
jgi:hypothetical protein